MADAVRSPSGGGMKEYFLRRGAKIIRLADVYDPADLDPFAHDPIEEDANRASRSAHPAP